MYTEQSSQDASITRRVLRHTSYYAHNSYLPLGSDGFQSTTRYYAYNMRGFSKPARLWDPFQLRKVWEAAGWQCPDVAIQVRPW
jgi:hypothetical protein